MLAAKGSARSVATRSRWAAPLLVFWLSACAGRPPLPPPPPAPVVTDASPTVTLTWSGRVDLDLYVSDPHGKVLFLGDNPTQAGVRLTADARCATLAAGAPGIERARLTGLETGRYMVGVDFIDTCGSGYDEVPFRLTFDGLGTRHEAEGTARPNQSHVWPIDILMRSPSERVGSAGPR